MESNFTLARSEDSGAGLGRELRAITTEGNKITSLGVKYYYKNRNTRQGAQVKKIGETTIRRG
jgi:hypothetical protein